MFAQHENSSRVIYLKANLQLSIRLIQFNKPIKQNDRPLNLYKYMYRTYSDSWMLVGNDDDNVLNIIAEHTETHSVENLTDIYIHQDYWLIKKSKIWHIKIWVEFSGCSKVLITMLIINILRILYLLSRGYREGHE